VTVWKPKDRRTYRYRFYLQGRPFEGNTRQVTEADALEFEEQEQRRLRRAGGGLAVAPEHSPRFSDWAAVYLQHVASKGRVRRLDHVQTILRVVLRFWGARPSGRDPKNKPVEGEPYHDLRLIDPIRDPTWILRFEAWMDKRPVTNARDGRTIGAQSKKHYLSILSRMYRVAKLPQYAPRTGVEANPFVDLERPRTRARQVTVTAVELRRWLQHTPRHAQLALAIAALAPKLRLENVLSLRWDQSFDPGLQFITVREHKTMDVTGQPMVVPIVPALRTMLKAAAKERTCPYVIAFRGERVHSIRHAVRTGAEAAGLTYGRDVADGVTFHTIRHTAATLLAQVPSLTEAQRAATMGQDIQTTQRYTHLKPAHQRPVLERLAARLRLGDIMDEAFGAPARGPAVPRPRRAGNRSEKRAVTSDGQRSRKTRSAQ
jgi:integrase